MIVPVYAAVVGLLIGQVMSQAAISPCAAGCVDGVLADVSKVGCGVGDTACVCSHIGDVTNGVRDCVAQACASEGAEQITLAEVSAKDRCAAAQASAAPTTTAAAEPTTTPPAAPASSETPAPPAEVTSTSTTEAVQSTTEAASSTTTAAESASITTSSTTLETSASVAVESSASTSAATSTSAETSSATQSGGTAAQTGTADASESEEGGLSVAAKAGIGAGVGVALIMMGIVAICLTVRRKQKENEARRGNMIEISGPLPGGGRQWANEEEGKYGSATTIGARESYSNELDRHARPYEEMVPHTQPRTMI